MNFNKLITNSMIISWLFLSYQILPMKNPQESKLRVFKRETSIVLNPVKNLFVSPENEKFFIKNIAEKPYLDAIKRIKKFVNSTKELEELELYHEDLFLIYNNPEFYEEYKQYIHAAEKKLQKKNKTIIEDTKTKLTSTNELKCPNHWISLAKTEPKFCCPTCLMTFFCTKECYNKYRASHEKTCKNNIQQKSLKNITNNENPKLKDVYIAYYNTDKKDVENLKIINQAKEKIRSSIKKDETKDLNCCFCKGHICKTCQKAHKKDLDCTTVKISKKHPEYKSCDLCLDAVYCDEVCFKKHTKEECLKNIIKKDLALNKCINNNQNLQEAILEKTPNIDTNTEKLKNIFKDNSVKHETRDGIDFFWLKTINHYNYNIVGCITKQYDISENKNFDPHETSGAQAIRNAAIINNFLDRIQSEQSEETIETTEEPLGQTKSNQSEETIEIIEEFSKQTKSNPSEEAIDRIKDLNNRFKARQYLQAIIEENETTSHLSAQTIRGRIGRESLAKKITVLDSVLQLEKKESSNIEDDLIIEEINKQIEKFKTKNNHFHTFIINTVRNTNQDKLKNENSASQNYKYVNDWYVLSLIKTNNNIICLIIDTGMQIETKNFTEISNKTKELNNKLLCKYILNKNDRQFNGIKKEIIAEVLNNFKNTHEPDIKISKELSEKIIAGSPKDVQNLVKSIQNKITDLQDSYILSGEPGTGKTFTAAAIAKITGSSLTVIQCGLIGTEFKNSEIVDLKAIVDQVIENSKHDMYHIIVLDEIEALSKVDDKLYDFCKINKAINGVLDSCKKHKIIFICTTNKYDELNRQLKSRAGGTEIKIDLPSYSIRKSLTEYFLDENSKKAKMDYYFDLNIKPDTLNYIAKKTNKFSIRDIKNLINKSCADIFIKKIGTTPQNKVKKSEIVIEDKDFIENINKIYTSIENNERTASEVLFDNGAYPLYQLACDLAKAYLISRCSALGAIHANQYNLLNGYKTIKSDLDSQIKESTKKDGETENKDLPKLIRSRKKLDQDFQSKYHGLNYTIDSELEDARAIKQSEHISIVKELTEKAEKLRSIDTTEAKAELVLVEGELNAQNERNEAFQTGKSLPIDFELKNNKAIEGSNYILDIKRLTDEKIKIESSNTIEEKAKLPIAIRAIEKRKEEHIAFQTGKSLPLDYELKNQRAIDIYNKDLANIILETLKKDPNNNELLINQIERKLNLQHIKNQTNYEISEKLENDTLDSTLKKTSIMSNIASFLSSMRNLVLPS